MSDWQDFMQQTVAVAEPTGSRDIDGNISYGTQRTVKCNVQKEEMLTRSNDGVMTSVRDIVYTHDPIKITERVWLPGTDTSDPNDAHKPFAVEPIRDPDSAQILYKVVM